jgi:hypothetical protein
MSLKPGVYAHAVGYRAAAGELLACAAAQAAAWIVYSLEFTCENGHRFRAMDADGCNVLTRDDAAERLAIGADEAPATSSAVIEFCLVCGTVDWLDDRYRREAEDGGEDAVRRAAPWTIGRTYQVSYARSGAPDGCARGSGQFTYRGLTAAGGAHRFNPAAAAPALYLQPAEIISVC